MHVSACTACVLQLEGINCVRNLSDSLKATASDPVFSGRRSRIIREPAGSSSKNKQSPLTQLFQDSEAVLS